MFTTCTGQRRTTYTYEYPYHSLTYNNGRFNGKELEERIQSEGTVKAGNVLKVDAFLNHQCDVRLFDRMGSAWAAHFAGKHITKILTIEASGIGIACVAAQHFGNVPVVFAKKAQSINLDGDQYTTTVYSFTKQKEFPVIVAKKYLNAGDHVLLIDDFLANGKALRGLIDLCEAAGATVEGIGIAVEKGFQAAVTRCALKATMWIRWPSSSP